MQDISAFGARVILRASVTFPQGVNLTQFSDDTDPFDIPTQEIGTATMGVNGDMIYASKATPVPITVSVIPNTDDDKNLDVLAMANTVGRGKQSARDIITITVVYPDGSQCTFSQGKLTNSSLAPGASSAGRLKTRVYTFAFEALTKSGAA
jgi:hypothetical protein